MKARGQYPWQQELCFIQLSFLLIKDLDGVQPQQYQSFNEWTSLLGLVHMSKVYRLGSFHQNQIELFIMIKGGLLYAQEEVWRLYLHLLCAQSQSEPLKSPYQLAWLYSHCYSIKTNPKKMDPLHFCLIEGEEKKSTLTNCRFTTISSQISAIYISIFHKIEVQTVILRC